MKRFTQKHREKAKNAEKEQSKKKQTNRCRRVNVYRKRMFLTELNAGKDKKEENNAAIIA